MFEDTIVAITTPPGRGGVGIVRLSGPKAYGIALQINKKRELIPRQAVFCSFYCNTNELVDQGLMLYFKAPHSFTGEDVVEIQAHGSPIVLDLLVKECIEIGARLARPGEFSERAFLNDKIDLTQAEAIADLIQASSQTAARMALKSLQGDFSKKVNSLNEELIHLRMYVEAAIDFPEEEIDFLNDGKVAKSLQSILDKLTLIRSEANQGVILREGLSLVITGRPNAGKSTLINSLAGRDIAIVTEVPGTTRDVMREHILLDDIPLHIIDTAGLRESNDIVEQEGIKRAWLELHKADCVLLVVDVNDPNQNKLITQEIKQALPSEVPIITVFNKIDLRVSDPKEERSTSIPSSALRAPSPHVWGEGSSTNNADHSIYISAQTGKGLDDLKTIIKQIVGYQPAEGQFLARRRHLQALDEAKELLLTGQRQLSEHRAGELLAEDLRLAHLALCAITGEFTSDDLLGTIFSSFCIGK